MVSLKSRHRGTFYVDCRNCLAGWLETFYVYHILDWILWNVISFNGGTFNAGLVSSPRSEMGEKATLIFRHYPNHSHNIQHGFPRPKNLVPAVLFSTNEGKCSLSLFFVVFPNCGERWLNKDYHFLGCCKSFSILSDSDLQFWGCTSHSHELSKNLLSHYNKVRDSDDALYIRTTTWGRCFEVLKISATIPASLPLRNSRLQIFCAELNLDQICTLPSGTRSRDACHKRDKFIAGNWIITSGKICSNLVLQLPLLSLIGRIIYISIKFNR